MNILIFHPDKEALEMISFCLESESGFFVHQAPSFKEAIDFFLEETPIDIIVSLRQPATDKLFKYLLSTGAAIPVILLEDGSDHQFEVYPDIRVLSQMSLQDVAENLVPLLKKHFNEIIDSAATEDYCRISTSLLTRVVPLRGDIFIRLSSVKFVKLFKTGAIFTGEDLEKFLVRKKVSHLYIRKADSHEFIDKFKQDLATFAEHAKTNSPELINTVAEIHDLILELTSRLGFNEEVKAIAKSNVKLALKAIGTSPKITKMLSSSQMKTKNYLCSHSVLLANISCSIAAQMSWPSDMTFQKLVLAALFHDIVFQNPEFAKISTKKALKELEAHLASEDLEMIRQHPLRCAEMIQSLSEVPADVNLIISQHHERPDGEGFPAGLRASQIAPLSAVFIVAHDILDQMTSIKGEFDLQNFLKQTEDQYQISTFKQIWKALANLDKTEGKEGTGSAA